MRRLLTPRARPSSARAVERIAELEERLRTEEAAHEVTQRTLNARLSDAQLHGARRVQNEQQRRVEHLARLAARRLMKRELARGWLQWHGVHTKNRETMRKALLMFSKHGQWRAFRQWRRAFPPRPEVSPEDLHAAQR